MSYIKERLNQAEYYLNRDKTAIQVALVEIDRRNQALADLEKRLKAHSEKLNRRIGNE